MAWVFIEEDRENEQMQDIESVKVQFRGVETGGVAEWHWLWEFY